MQEDDTGEQKTEEVGTSTWKLCIKAKEKEKGSTESQMGHMERQVLKAVGGPHGTWGKELEVRQQARTAKERAKGN